MARASINTLLSLDQWAQIVGINPWEFNQIAEGLPVQNRAQCPHVWFQYPWQQEWIGREELANCIRQAEELIAEKTNIWPAPNYIVEEWNQPNYPSSKTAPIMTDSSGRYKAIKTRYSHLRNFGVFTRSLINADVAVTLSDEDGDLLNETFTLTTVSTSLLTADEIGVYTSDADRLGQDLDETWRIRPLRISVSGTTITIKGHISLLVKPSLAEIYDAQVLNVTEAIFVSTLDVYRVYTDSTATADDPNQGLAIWDPLPNCASDCSVLTGAACFSRASDDAGIARVQIKSDQRQLSRFPDRFQINYLAGIPLTSNGLMNFQWARAVAYLAISLMPAVKCGCERSNAIINYWRTLANQGDSEARPILAEEISMNQLGDPRRGTLYAWKFIKEQIGDGTLT